MNFDQMKHSGIKVFRIHNPRATSVIAPEFRTMLVDEIQNFPGETFAIDFSKVDYIDSSFIGSLVAAYKEAVKHDVKIKLFGTQERVGSTFESTRLYTLFEIYKNFTQLKKTLE
jgi:anti-sigma B factor antagonist